VRWAFDQDVTLTALAGAPPDDALTAGRWWPKGYEGPPQVVLDADIAKGAGIGVGDRVTVAVLGRDLEAKVAGLRRVEWSRFGASFPIIFDAAALKGANLREIAIAKTDKAGEDRALRSLGADFPGVNVISVREQLETATKIFDQLAWAVRGAAGVAALAGLLVLIGAVAASAQARTREAAILKVLGASRLAVLSAYAVEYGAVGLIAGAAGLLLGLAAAYPVVALVFHAPVAFDALGLGAVLAGVAGAGAIVGGVAAFAALARRPAPVLRAD
jgi:putative ABC transport system permease protein